MCPFFQWGHVGVPKARRKGKGCSLLGGGTVAVQSAELGRVGSARLQVGLDSTRLSIVGLGKAQWAGCKCRIGSPCAPRVHDRTRCG